MAERFEKTKSIASNFGWLLRMMARLAVGLLLAVVAALRKLGRALATLVQWRSSHKRIAKQEANSPSQKDKQSKLK